MAGLAEEATAESLSLRALMPDQPVRYGVQCAFTRSNNSNTVMPSAVATTSMAFNDGLACPVSSLLR